MITVTNRKQYNRMEWDKYISLPGYSFSGLRNTGPITPTAKMRLGTYVDKYLFTPHEYKGEMRDVVVPIARRLKEFLGSALDTATPQLALTANFTYQGLTMPFRGLADLPVGRDLILDLKVSELDTVKAIQHFRYDWQIEGYKMAYGATRGMIMSIHPKTKKITTLPINGSQDWWCHQVLQYGKPCN